ncbi:retrovirus-related Pol polyprotein from transposon 17.6 [Caerostris extrusa]|uniref:Retrovirus-related Pol polyprotein from transposon 17.6 n=1 Tax=Caerostris extrusa TaxID=172846 RepID=A0AAV4R4W4_CAEEX|nr:retrovirus-related Pol polyprotein from transposon 17.6 [Caerostris extrusa]
MNKGILITYMDDLIIPSKDEVEGVEKLKVVLGVASKYGLEIKFKKCQFLKRNVEFLGHIVENGTIRPSPAKTLAVKRFPVPTNVKRVQSFLVKTVSTRDALDKPKLQQKTFGNPLRIISDRGSAFTSKAFNDYCTEEGIQHLQIATGVPRGNGQIERIHRTLIPVLTKLSLEDATKWYRYVDKLQRILNSTTNRSTKWTPFELLTGVKMKNKEDI